MQIAGDPGTASPMSAYSIPTSQHGCVLVSATSPFFCRVLVRFARENLAARKKFTFSNCGYFDPIRFEKLAKLIYDMSRHKLIETAYNMGKKISLLVVVTMM